LYRLSFVEFEEFHPLKQNLLVFEEYSLFLVNAISVADLDAESYLPVEDATDGQPLQTDRHNRKFHVAFLADNQNRVKE